MDPEQNLEYVLPYISILVSLQIGQKRLKNDFRRPDLPSHVHLVFRLNVVVVEHQIIEDHQDLLLETGRFLKL